VCSVAVKNLDDLAKGKEPSRYVIFVLSI